MKLKYYMRGLGIGILLTTIIFVLSGYNKVLTDEEIKERAAELGMVSEDHNTVSGSRGLRSAGLRKIPDVKKKLNLIKISFLIQP